MFPAQQDSAFELPYPMNYYGPCDFDSVVIGLENFFVDCIELADQAAPEIVFDQYDGIIIFHAGSDQQNNIGFPETCSDLFTGFISFGDSVEVDNGATYVRMAMLMPETASQDNRATALNAVMAHEFGHVLGLPDLYSSATFMSQLGDFSLMEDSPCIDAGVSYFEWNENELVNMEENDYYGSAPDMGAFEYGMTGSEDPIIPVVIKPSLGQNYPNPFMFCSGMRSFFTTISYSLPGDFENASLSIYNIKGQKIRYFKVGTSGLVYQLLSFPCSGMPKRVPRLLEPYLMAGFT